tara:strand:- start:161 stop:346 length:186 start_codon:yes stop_codon:yes gene_type:complete
VNGSKLIETCAGLLLALFFSFFFAFVLFNWALGCGEMIHTATGPVPGECLTITQLYKDATE